MSCEEITFRKRQFFAFYATINFGRKFNTDFGIIYQCKVLWSSFYKRLLYLFWKEGWTMGQGLLYIIWGKVFRKRVRVIYFLYKYISWVFMILLSVLLEHPLYITKDEAHAWLLKLPLFCHKIDVLGKKKFTLPSVNIISVKNINYYLLDKIKI